MSVQTLEIGEVSPQVGSAVPAQITPQSSSPGPFETMGLLIAYTRNEEIYGEGEAAEFLYKVKSGCVRTYKVLNDGRRQIASFYLPGDVFGLTVGEQHTSSAEASVASEVIAIKRSALRSRASVESALALLLMGLAVMELQRTPDHALPRKSGSQHSCSIWPNVKQAIARFSCRCHDRKSPIISASRLRPYHAH